MDSICVRFVHRTSLPSFARTGRYFWRAKVTKTPSLETFAGRACAEASFYISQSFRGDISFNNGPCNHLSTKTFLNTKYYNLFSLRTTNRANDRPDLQKTINGTFTFHQAMEKRSAAVA
ncbi:hypothetical protein DI53_2145 [Sphingobacterium deserti]|uniref:Uncharacterized protein n=1 Tax=Sphingobacterium deserti TaxID=1229276 RepID=A0A0B8T0M7_9SPHI|nr:hypothetical protein DI53_2145 [Sphingobacterium deserti]